ARLELGAHLLEAVEDGRGVVGWDDAGVGQHAGVRHRPPHVVEGDTPVNGERGRVGVYGRVGGLGEAPAPWLVRALALLGGGLVAGTLRALSHVRVSRAGSVESCAHVSETAAIRPRRTPADQSDLRAGLSLGRYALVDVVDGQTGLFRCGGREVVT